MTAVGYQYVLERLGLKVLPLARPASIRSVTRVEDLGSLLAVPALTAPAPELVSHLLFALKHEGPNLQVLGAACERLDPAELRAELQRKPTGGYIRKLCFLWEGLTGRLLEDLPAALGGVPQLLFDPAHYVTTRQGAPNKRWRVTFNGLGDWTFCPTVRRTPEIESLIASDPLGAARAFLEEFSKEQLERMLAWAYLHETRSSYAIEGESPPTGKAEAFVALLRQAHQKHALTEQYLVSLQNEVVSSPYAREPSFRQSQNYLSNGAPGARGVTYVPPPASMLPTLMPALARLANLELCPDLDPLTRATLVSFGFVFAHPFMDGNGRLSRFLAHYTLCQSGALPGGTILPLSTAMKRNENEYLRALQSFSAPARELWKVLWLDHEEFSFEFLGHESIYRFWDATPCVEFLYRMAQEAVRTDLRGEAEFLSCYDSVVRAVSERFDVPGSTLSKLIVMAYQNGGTLSKHRRKQFADRVDPAALDFIEAQVRATMPATPP